MDPNIEQSQNLNMFLNNDLSSLTVSKTGDLRKKTLTDKIKQLSPKIRGNQETLVKDKLQQLMSKMALTKDTSGATKLCKKIFPQLKDSKLIKNLETDQKTKNFMKEVEWKIYEEMTPALYKKMQELKSSKPKLDNDQKSQLSPEERQKRNDVRLAIRILKVQAGIQLGTTASANKGATGTLILRSITGKPLTVFKPEETSSLSVRFKNFFKKHCGGQLYHLLQDKGAQSKAEVAASEVDKFFNFNITPPSEWREDIEGKKGTFQLFVKNHEEAQGKIDEFDKKNDFSEKEIDSFQKMAVFDYLIGNLDRHDENWFIPTNCENPFEHIKVIDNANAFIVRNPSKPNKIKNQYAWKSKKIAQQPFSDNIKKFIQDNLNEKNIEKFINEMNNHQTAKALFTNKEIVDNFKNRAQILFQFANMGKFSQNIGNFKEGDNIRTPAELGKLVTSQQITDFLKEKRIPKPPTKTPPPKTTTSSKRRHLDPETTSHANTNKPTKNK